jgi:hypothetical protein
MPHRLMLLAGVGLGVALSVPAQAAPNDLGPLLSAAIGRCWNPPAHSTGSVTVRFDLNENGSVNGAPRVIGLASAGVAKSAVHAIQLCAPYHLPADRYTDWHHASVTLSTGP